jgi:epoxide hydrolase-like predicted phosphatase
MMSIAEDGHLPDWGSGAAKRTNVKGLVVDWGGVLTTGLRESLAAWAEADGIDYVHYEQVMRDWLGDSYGQQARVNPVSALERGEMEVPHFEEELARRLRTREGLAVSAPGLLTRMFERFEHAPDMHAVVRRARRAAIRTALLSNSWGNSYPREGWEEMFDAVVISGEVGMRKPEPEIYLHVSRLLRLAPAECVFVDDLSINVAAAIEVGMVGVHHTSYDTTVAELESLFGVTLTAD